MPTSDTAGPAFDIRRGRKLYYENFELRVGARKGGDVQLLIAGLCIKDLD